MMNLLAFSSRVIRIRSWKDLVIAAILVGVYYGLYYLLDKLMPDSSENARKFIAGAVAVVLGIIFVISFS